MSGRAYLLIAAVANCCSTVQLSRLIYTISNGRFPDFTYDVCCFYNGSAHKPWDIQLSLENQSLQAALIDEGTISYRVSKALIRRKSLELRCLWPNNGSTNFTIEESTFLRPYKFSCLYTDIEMELKCQFDHPVEETETNPFILIMDNTFKVECIDFYGDLPECTLKYPIHFRGVIRNFTFELHSHGILRRRRRRRRGLAKDLPSTMCCGNILCEIIAARTKTRRQEQTEKDTRLAGYPQNK